MGSNSQRPLIHALVLLLPALGALACGPKYRPPPFDREVIELERKLQLDASFGGAIERTRRGFAVGEPVLVAAGQVCDRTVATIGARFGSTEDFAIAARPYVRSHLKLNKDVRVLQVLEGFGAHSAGLRENDLVIEINGVEPRSGQHALALLQLAGPNLIRFGRDARTFQVGVQSLAKCDYPVFLPADRELNAWSDGERIAVTSSLMNLLDDDDELAFVVAHEAAHNVLLHSDKTRTNAEIGALIGALLDIAAEYYTDVDTEGLGEALGAHVGSRVYSKAFEREADYIGLYLVELAGFDVASGVSALRKLAASNPAMVSASPLSSHPGTAERAVAMGAIAGEIRRRLISGELPAPARRPLARPGYDDNTDGLSYEVVALAESRGAELGRAMACRVSGELVEDFKLETRRMLAEATLAEEERSAAWGVFEGSVARSAGRQAGDEASCHPVIVDFYSR